jgi:hypothetical protein
MPPTTLKFRLDSVQLERWRLQAKQAGVPLSEWIRKRCDEEPARLETVLKIREQLQELSPPKVADDNFDEVREQDNSGSATQDVPGDRNLRVVRRSAAAAAPAPRTPDAQPSLPLSGVSTDAHPRDCRCRVCEFARDAGVKPPLPPQPKKEPKRVKEKEKGRRR